MKKIYKILLLIGLIGIGFSDLTAETTQKTPVPNATVNIDDLTTQIFKQGNVAAETITWHDESAITILQVGRIVFRKAFFSPYGYNGSFIEGGAWSPKGSYFAFRLLSSGGHMPYRTPVKIFQMKGKSSKLIDAEAIIEKIPGISNIAVGPYKKPYILWLSDTRLQVSVISQDKKSDSGMYVIDLKTLTAKKAPETDIHEKGTKSSSSVHPGTALRKEILDALRKKIMETLKLDMVFVVKYIKIKGDWVWVHTLPQSKDGKDHYEDISALLKRENGVWRVVEFPCSEEEDPECISSPTYFSNLKKRFPDLPEEILPQE